MKRNLSVLACLLSFLFPIQVSAMFVQADTWEITHPGVGLNRYSYSYNDPINLSDPSGNAAPFVIVGFMTLGAWFGGATSAHAPGPTNDIHPDSPLRITRNMAVGMAGGALIGAGAATLGSACMASGTCAGTVTMMEAAEVATDIATCSGTDCLGAALPLVPYVVIRAATEPTQTAAKTTAKSGDTVSSAGRRATSACSFHGDTQVMSPQGMMLISLITEGQLVFSTNEVTGASGWKPVEKAYSNFYQESVYVRVQTSDGKLQTIISNRTHPFFAIVSDTNQAEPSSEGHRYQGAIPDGHWIDAQYLQPGFSLQEPNGQTAFIEAVQIVPEPFQSFNLDVWDYDTFYVAVLNWPPFEQDR